MPFTAADLNLTDPTKGYFHFVLYAEPQNGAAGAAWNATISIERPSMYSREWMNRLQRCEPDTLHTTLVHPQKMPSLFQPCVDEDPDSPSALMGSGCTCRRTWTDPLFGLPVVGEHYRTVGGQIDQWTYFTYAPLDLRPDDVLSAVVIDRDSGLFWARTSTGDLALLPMSNSQGYDVGRRGGGPGYFAEYLHQVVASNGRDTAIARQPYNPDVDPNLLAWVSSPHSNRTQELTLPDLKAIQRG
ncbi:hypothetical protein [Actinomadura harenae]|uniref:Uncharacterized protein n=1 Tax=Actinomadura harenae TaxID=2483351 RepID=A0A3M2LSA6_9ACTN|nr:hypothetical protein [Actinomadura harenae]RMI39966.1 hypothetical protein EBO15_28135 [Actinomadura harenae]